MKNTTRMINLLIVTALLGSASNMNALSRPSAPQEKKAVTSKAAEPKEAAKPGRIKRMRNWMGREIFNRQKLGRNAKYGAGMAALIYSLMVATARMRRDSLRANTAWAPTRAAGWVADSTWGAGQRALKRLGVPGSGHLTRDPFNIHRNFAMRDMDRRMRNDHDTKTNAALLFEHFNPRSAAIIRDDIQDKKRRDSSTPQYSVYPVQDAPMTTATQYTAPLTDPVTGLDIDSVTGAPFVM